MRTSVPEKLLKIIDEIDQHGQASLTRLTVLKKWFARPERLSAFAVWVAARAVSRKGKTSGAVGTLFLEARTVLAGLDEITPKLNRQAGSGCTIVCGTFNMNTRTSNGDWCASFTIGTCYW